MASEQRNHTTVRFVSAISPDHGGKLDGTGVGLRQPHVLKFFRNLVSPTKFGLLSPLINLMT